VGGDGLARGYLNDPKLTSERFVPLAGARVYKTGDLARWLPNGNLDFLGRADDQAKVRGYRIEPGEIEACLRAHRGVESAVALVVEEKSGEKALCAWVVSPGRDRAMIQEHLTAKLPLYMVPAHLVFVDQLPLKTNGKVDRERLPRPWEAVEEEESDPGDAVETKMESIWQEVLGLKKIGLRRDFFDLGGHSMKALRLISLIHREFKVKLGLEQVLRSITVEQLSNVVRSMKPEPYHPLEKQASREFYELSISQRRLAEVYKQDPENTAFNVVHHFRMARSFDEETARRVLAILVERHDGLRTRLRRHEGTFVQVVDEFRRGPQCGFRIHDLRGAPGERHAQVARLAAAEEGAAFDLENGPVYRVTIVLTGRMEFEVLWSMHHIVSDGWSMDTLENEFRQAYVRLQNKETVELEPVQLQFKDYLLWQGELLRDEVSSRAEKDFWSSALRPPLRMIELPYDFPKTNTVMGIGRPSAGYHSTIPAETTERLRALAREEKTSLFLVLFTAFNVLLAELSGRSDVVTGIPSANRFHDGLKNTVGFLVDSVVIRNHIGRETPMVTLVRQVSETTLRSLDHAAYPIELACAAAGVTWPEILSTFFNMTTFGDVNRSDLTDPGWYAVEHVQNAKMEFVLYLVERRNGVEINTHYYTELFAPSTIERFMRRYAAIVEEIASGSPTHSPGETTAIVTGRE